MANLDGANLGGANLDVIDREKLAKFYECLTPEEKHIIDQLLPHVQYFTAEQVLSNVKVALRRFVIDPTKSYYLILNESIKSSETWLYRELSAELKFVKRVISSFDEIDMKDPNNVFVIIDDIICSGVNVQKTIDDMITSPSGMESFTSTLILIVGLATNIGIEAIMNGLPNANIIALPGLMLPTLSELKLDIDWKVFNNLMYTYESDFMDYDCPLVYLEYKFLNIFGSLPFIQLISKHTPSKSVIWPDSE